MPARCSCWIGTRCRCAIPSIPAGRPAWLPPLPSGPCSSRTKRAGWISFTEHRPKSHMIFGAPPLACASDALGIVRPPPNGEANPMSPRVGSVIAAAVLILTACGQQEPAGVPAALLAASSATVIVSPSSATLDVGGTQQFSAQLLKNGGQKKAAFTWSSSDPSVATVSSAGLVTAVAPGEATITASASTRESGTAQVTVRSSAPTPPQVVAHIPLNGGAFGSGVSAPGVGWISQPNNGTVSRLDIASATLTGTTGAGPLPVQISANADGSHIYVPTFFSNAMVTEINTSTLATEATAFATPDQQDAYGITNTPAGDTVFVGITNGPVFKMAMSTGAVVGTLNFPIAAGYHFEWNGGHTRLYASQRAFDRGRYQVVCSAAEWRRDRVGRREQFARHHICHTELQPLWIGAYPRLPGRRLPQRPGRGPRPE